MTTTLVLVRHGQTTANLGGRIDTMLPGAPLTPTGRAQVEHLAATIATGWTVEVVYSSVAVRAVESGRILADRLGTPHRTLDGVQEIVGGRFDGRTDTAARDGYLEIYRRWQHGELDGRQPDGESGREALTRLVPAITAVADGHPGGTSLLVGHAAAIELVTTALCGNVEGSFAVGHSLSSCAIVVLVRDVHGWHCHRWDDVEFAVAGAKAL